MSNLSRFMVIRTESAPPSWRDRGAIILCRSDKDCSEIYASLKSDIQCTGKVFIETLNVPGDGLQAYALRFADIETSNYVLGIIGQHRFDSIDITAYDDAGVQAQINEAWSEFRKSSSKQITYLGRHTAYIARSNPTSFTNS